MQNLGIITALTRKNAGRAPVEVYVDGCLLGCVGDDLALMHGLRVGAPLERQNWEELLAQQHRRDALHEATRFLSTRMRTRAQIEQRLRAKGYEPPAIHSALERLAQYGYIDDAAYAAALVSDRVQGKGLSKRAIGYELARSGVSDEVAQAALAAYDEDAQYDTALALVQKLLRTSAARLSDPQKRRAHVYAALARRGFDADIARRALCAALDARQDDEPWT